MRRIVTAISAAALALSMVAQAVPANAVAGFDSQWAGQTASLTLSPGSPGAFTVFFDNTGTTTWTHGTATQVDLTACLADKTTCNAQDASDAPFNSGWVSLTKYATQSSEFSPVVPSGGRATFSYNILVPTTQAAGLYRFNGALVLSTTNADIHNVGYYQDLTVTGPVTAPAPACTATGITTSPALANNQVGATHTQTATVTCDPPTGSTTRPAAASTSVTFIIDAPVGSLNADLTLAATTDANGVATVSWSRTNPDSDSISVYPTALPAVRATATKTWSVGASVILCDPAAAATVLAGSSRTFTITVRNPSTGALAASQSVTLAFVETSGTPTAPATPITTGTGGQASFSLTGIDATKGTVRATTIFGTTTYRADCGTTTFEAVRAGSISVTPDTTATNAANGRRVYTISAVDQFGAPFTGAVQISFNELTDADVVTTTNAIVEATQAGGTSPTPATGACAAPTGFAGNQKAALTLGSTGAGFFIICSLTATTANPVVWHDRDGNGIPSTGEAQDTGGATTWTAAAVTSASLTPASATNTASTEDPAVNDDSLGEETYTAELANQSGNNFPPATGTAVVTFTVRNTSSSGNVVITLCQLSNGTPGTISAATVSPNTSQTCTVTIANLSALTAQVEIDRGVSAAGTATIDASIAYNGVNYVATQATKTWVAAGTVIVQTTASATTATGNVVAFDKVRNAYTISTDVGNFTIYYDGGDNFRVAATTTTIANFETNLTLGDKIEFVGGSGTPPASHRLTNQ